MKDVFSDAEQKVLQIVGKRKLTFAEILDQFYGEDPSSFFEVDNYMAGVIRRINRKCEFHKLSFYLASEGRGLNGRTIWKEKR